MSLFNIAVTKEEKQFIEAVKESPASVVVAVICFFSVWSVLGLAGFHTYLTTSNQTTNEDVIFLNISTLIFLIFNLNLHWWYTHWFASQIKGSFTGKRGQDKINPYSKGGVCANCIFILCGPMPPSFIGNYAYIHWLINLFNATITILIDFFSLSLSLSLQNDR